MGPVEPPTQHKYVTPSHLEHGKFIPKTSLKEFCYHKIFPTALWPALQVEGGARGSSVIYWDEFCTIPGRIADGSNGVIRIINGDKILPC